MKSVLISIKPYWLFLIIANQMGWKINKEKQIEIRKTFPKDKAWDKVVKLYCTKDKKSFVKIPKEYQPLMEQFLGKVIGEFVCDKITYLGNISTDPWCVLLGDVHESHKQLVINGACLTEEELLKYGGKFSWHISNLVIYDKPRNLNEFSVPFEYKNSTQQKQRIYKAGLKVPQSWCYIESEVRK